MIYQLLYMLFDKDVAIKFICQRSVTLKIAGVYFFLQKPGDLVTICDCLLDGMYGGDREFIPTNGGVCLDIRANIGACTAFWIKKGRPGRVITVEPHPDTCERLHKNISLNSWDNVEIVNMALSSQDGEIDIAISQESAMARIGWEQMDQMKVKSARLDTILEQRGIESVELCKIDVEGHEVHVLKGAKNSLSRIKRIIIEYHSMELRQEVIKMLEPLFSIVRIDDSDIGLIYAEVKN
ncbi:MAG: FkbM family methyltransferase [Candidatus Omnitrophota bacterium]